MTETPTPRSVVTLPARQKQSRPIPARLLPLADAVSHSGMSRSTIYRHLAEGTLRGRKSGRSLLIETDSLERLLCDLPIATFGRKRRA